MPLLDWLNKSNSRLRARVRIQLLQLAEEGNNLRRPAADYLRDGVYELRIKQNGINYRILYAFDGRDVVFVSHSMVKQQARVEPKEIDLAVQRLRTYKSDRAHFSHHYEPETP